MKQLISILILLTIACSNPTGPQVLELGTDRDTYHYGDTLALTLVNKGPKSVGPAAAALECLLKLELKLGDVWDPVRLPTVSCGLVDRNELATGEAVERQVEVTQDIFPSGGTYRFLTSQAIGVGSIMEIVSNSFDVTAP